MLTKFAIDYLPLPHHRNVSTHFTDDPLEAEEFLMHLLVTGAHIKAIRHEGALLLDHAFDRMLKVAAERTVSAMLQVSLSLDAVQVKDRFGFAA